MNAFFKFSKELANRDFISFMEEKQIHPSDLISLAIKIKNKSLFNEYSNLSSSGFLSGIGGALRGMYHGFRAGLGTRSLNSATITLKKQLQLAYEKFLDSLIGITGNEVAAVRIVTMLRKNAEQDIDHRVFGMAPIVPKPETTAPTSSKKKPVEVEEPEEEKPEEEKPEEESVDEEPEEESSEEEETEDEDEGFTGVAPPEEETEEETEEEPEEDDSLTPDDIEKPSLKDQFHEMLITGNTSDIHTRISNDFPSRSRSRTESIDALIECLNANETSKPYREEGLGIINQIYAEFLRIKQALAKSFSKYVMGRLSPNLRRILLGEKESSGSETIMTFDQKRNLIMSRKVKEYHIDQDKIDDEEDFASTLHRPLLFLQKLGERNTRVLERDSQNIKIDKPNAMIKMIIDDMKNYVYLYKDDLIKLGAAL
jgi:hypothetical protein